MNGALSGFVMPKPKPEPKPELACCCAWVLRVEGGERSQYCAAV